MKKTDEETFQDVKNILVPSTSDVLYGLIDGSIVSSTWNTLTGKTDQLFSYVLRRTGDSVGGTLGDFLNYLGEGATYVCYTGGKQVAYSTSTKDPIVAASPSAALPTARPSTGCSSSRRWSSTDWVRLRS